MFYENQSYYEGNFSQNQYQGEGKFFWPNSYYYYDGNCDKWKSEKGKYFFKDKLIKECSFIVANQMDEAEHLREIQNDLQSSQENSLQNGMSVEKILPQSPSNQLIQYNSEEKNYEKSEISKYEALLCSESSMQRQDEFSKSSSEIKSELITKNEDHHEEIKIVKSSPEKVETQLKLTKSPEASENVLNCNFNFSEFKGEKAKQITIILIILILI